MLKNFLQINFEFVSLLNQIWINLASQQLLTNAWVPPEWEII